MLFAAEYAASKEAESALDFEDLQLLARDLLAADRTIREEQQLRFRAIMVDEFQDTNALQCELVDLLAGLPAGASVGVKDVFFVGDEFQSIYGFRHADVRVFRERGERASRRLSLTENYRSRPEVLAAVNVLFGEEFGDGYQPLAASGAFPDPVFGHPVELLVTDRASYRESGDHWRRAEARHIARRIRELVDTTAARPGRSSCSSRPGPTPSGTRRSCVRRACRPTARPAGATSPSSRSSTCSCTSVSCATATTTRRS